MIWAAFVEGYRAARWPAAKPPRAAVPSDPEALRRYVAEQELALAEILGDGDVATFGKWSRLAQEVWDRESSDPAAVARGIGAEVRRRRQHAAA